MDAGMLKSLKFGAKFTDHEREAVFNATTYGAFFAPMNRTGCNGGPCSSSFFAAGPTPGDFLDAIAANGTLTRYWLVDKGLVEQHVRRGLHRPHPVSAAELLHHGGVVRGLRHGQPRRRSLARQCRRALREHRSDLDRQPDRRAQSGSRQPVRRLHAGHGRSLLRRRAAEPEPRV